MDKELAANAILDNALPNVTFDGWSETLLMRAARQAGFGAGAVFRVFPAGVSDALDCFAHRADEAMVATMAEQQVDKMKIRERIAASIKARLDYLLPHREAVRRALSFYLLPHHAHEGLRVLYRTVDAMWHAAGDHSTDFNFYTKRLTLAGVYMATLRFWLDDESDNQQETWAFLDRRIENVMQIERGKQKLRSLFE